MIRTELEKARRKARKAVVEALDALAGFHEDIIKANLKEAKKALDKGLNE
jgi:hypothetical protein